MPHCFRFIPLDKWPLIIMSLFAWHNETRAFFLSVAPASSSYTFS